VEDGDTIFIDASSTTYEFAKVCRGKKNNLHVVTTSLITALELIKNPTNTVTVIGGTVRIDNMSVIGSTAEKMAKDLNVEKIFISCRTFEPAEGTFETNSSESVIKRIMADNSNKVYLLVDSSKLFKRATFFTIPIDKINAIVTDDKGNELLRSLPSRIKIV
jgi:DeoR/GlpR family transcriptional regulator of sugar metabolism